MDRDRKPASSSNGSRGTDSHKQRKGHGPPADHFWEYLALDKIFRVLEVGCGDGALALELARRAAYVAGVDVSDESVAAAEDRRLQSGMDNLSFGPMAPDRLPFDDKTFEVVVSWGALHRLENQPVMVREMVRVLKSAGKLYLADIVGADDPGRREAQEKIEQIRFGPAVKLLPLNELRSLVAVEPMEIVREIPLHERMDLADWMSPDRVDPGTREKLTRMVTATAKKKTPDAHVHVSGKTVTFERRWVLIIAEKTGNM